MKKFNDLVKLNSTNDSRSLLNQFKTAIENKRKSPLNSQSPRHLLNTLCSSKSDNLHSDIDHHHDFHRDFVTSRKALKTLLPSRK